jgi:hypothetical protein
VLHEVIREVFSAWPPDDLKLPLAGTVSDPVKTHVNGFGAALFDGVIEDASGAFVCRFESLWEVACVQVQ